MRAVAMPSPRLSPLAHLLSTCVRRITDASKQPRQQMWRAAGSQLPLHGVRPWAAPSVQPPRGTRSELKAGLYTYLHDVGAASTLVYLFRSYKHACIPMCVMYVTVCS